jgi:hypothetical protein
VRIEKCKLHLAVGQIQSGRLVGILDGHVGENFQAAIDQEKGECIRPPYFRMKLITVYGL